MSDIDSLVVLPDLGSSLCKCLCILLGGGGGAGGGGGGGMWQVWERREMHTVFWCETLNVRNPIEDLQVQAGKIIKKQNDERLWAGPLRTGTRSGFL